jgi:hypothetical protein
MLSGFNLNEILVFPVKDAEARKHFLVGTLVSFAAMIIPIVPYLALFGYAARIARQVLNAESPRMIAWDDWGGMVKDGLKMFGVRMILGLPIIIAVLPLILASIAFPIFVGNANSAEVDTFFAIFTVIMLASLCIIIPISIPLTVIIPAAEMYVLEKEDFAAGLRFREWWPILRANLGGFIAAFAIYYLTAMITIFVIQLLGATIILACLMFVLLPASTIYITLIMYVTAAQAYRDGKVKLAQNEPAPKPA